MSAERKLLILTDTGNTTVPVSDEEFEKFRRLVGPCVSDDACMSVLRRETDLMCTIAPKTIVYFPQTYQFCLEMILRKKIFAHFTTCHGSNNILHLGLS